MYNLLRSPTANILFAWITLLDDYQKKIRVKNLLSICLILFIILVPIRF